MAYEKYGSDVIVDMLKLYGIKYLPLNPGASYRGLHDSIVNYGGNSPEIIECTHEKIAVGLAHGYTRATGEACGAIVHNLVGLLHSAMGVYYAYVDEAPVILLGATGPMDTTRRRPFIDWIHTAQDQGDVVRDYTKWDDQPHTVAAVPESFARAYRVATTPPYGPVYLCYDSNLQEDPLLTDVHMPDPKRLGPPEPSALHPRTVEKVAEMLVQAKHPVVLTDMLGQSQAAVDKLEELAELLALPVVDGGRRGNFPNTNRLDVTGNREIFANADLLLALEVRDFERALTTLNRTTRERTPIIPDTCKIIDIGYRDTAIKSWAQTFLKIREVDVLATADPTTALEQIIDAVRGLVGRSPKAEVKERMAAITQMHDNMYLGWQEQSKAGWDSKPMTLPRLSHEIWNQIKDEDWVMTGAVLDGWNRRLWDFTKAYQFPGAPLGTGTQVGISLGVALGHKGTGKLVVSIQPDGDLMFDAGSLWIAAYHKIPMLTIMYNNRAYYNDWEHQIAIAKDRGRDEEMAYLGMELAHPEPDFGKLAQAMGWHGEGPIEDPNELGPAIQRAIKYIKETGMPALVDAVTQVRG
ncbi:MAG: thiamine pyrophosphate-binding protein [Dehalococcoidia bacterium]